MYFRPVILALSAALLCVVGTSCQKSTTLAPSVPPTVLSPDTAASVHWRGKHWLGYEATAYFFMRVWNLPATAQLERQTLSKLATTPGQWLPGGTNLTADAVSRLWLMFNDLVQDECYLEIRQPTNAAGEIVFAIRLNAAHSEQWLTNLPAVLEPLTGGRIVSNPTDHSWSLQITNVLNRIQLSRVGEWTVVSAGPAQNSLAGEIAERIRHDGAPFGSAGTNLWLEASLDFPRLATVFPLSAGGEGWGEVGIFSTLKHLNLTVTGDGGNVITRGNVSLNQAFLAPLTPWHLPVNLLHEPLTSLTAVRGLEPWLSEWPVWHDLQIGNAPDQLYLWSFAGTPYQLYFAAPVTDAGHQVAGLTDHLLQQGNPWLAARGYISFDRAADGNGVTWGNLPNIKPFIKAVGTTDDGWLYAGLFSDTNSAALPVSPGLIQDILRRTNLVYYDWEVTGPRLQPSLQLAQTVRQVARLSQMSLDSASLNCLAALEPRLGTSATIINRTGPNELTLYRRSTIGFTALELHLLADWFESPRFPQ